MKIFFALLLALPAFAQNSPEFKVKKSIELFNQAATVFQHPRCLNCHPSGETPTQGMDMHVHTMNVKRGEADFGVDGMHCMTCHQDHNNKDSGVPGAPNWALAPKEMAWQGLSKRELCLQLKDPSKTHKTMEEMIEHNSNDTLVAWGWKPGKHREPAPMTQKKFGEIFKAWVESGAHCPND